MRLDDNLMKELLDYDLKRLDFIYEAITKHGIITVQTMYGLIIYVKKTEYGFQFKCSNNKKIIELKMNHKDKVLNMPLFYKQLLDVSYMRLLKTSR